METLSNGDMSHQKDRHSVPRCGIILAGGEGTRLRNYVREFRGDSLPKQYVNFTGHRSMLEQTFHRAEKLISPERIFTVVDFNHLDFPDAVQQLSNRSAGTIVLQPKNLDTGPGVLLPLMHVYKYYPESVVAVFPSDHFIAKESLFMDYLDSAFRMTELNPSNITLLGIKPHQPETEYGYVLPSKEGRFYSSLFFPNIQRFVEKPDLISARGLVRMGGLWNTFIMVFKAKTMLKLIQKQLPPLYHSFQEILKSIGTPEEMKILERAYTSLKPLNFSKGFLEILPLKDPTRLKVLPVEGVEWSDWGSPGRLRESLFVLKMQDQFDRKYTGTYGKHINPKDS